MFAFPTRDNREQWVPMGHQWCTDGVPILYRWCTDGYILRVWLPYLKVHIDGSRWCTNIVLMVYQWEPMGTNGYQWCTDGSQCCTSQWTQRFIYVEIHIIVGSKHWADSTMGEAKYSITLRVGKPDKDGVRPVYGECTVNADTEEELEQSLNRAIMKLTSQL